jgi:hypothetical protein
MQVLVRLTVWSFPVFLVAGCGGSDEGEPATTAEFREGRIVLQDDFSDPTSGWYSGVSEESEVSYAEGGYRILQKQARLGWAYSELEPSLLALRLEVEATQLAGTSEDEVGALCYTDVVSDVGYIFGIDPVDRSYYVSAFRGDDYRDLESSEADAIRPQEEENRLRIECIASRDGPTVLTLAVNGQAIVRTEDERGRREFDGVGFFVDSTEGGAEAVFDDLVVTALVPR